MPKGLRAFSSEDRGFFLNLLPGPRNYQGLPESILFWQKLIENQGAFDVFSVGLIYGESGCGKSSFVKAGLIPLLSAEIKTIYVESTQHDTVLRLIKLLRTKFPELPADLSLPDVFALIRDGDVLEAGQKLLIVIDQFEQWLSSNCNYGDSQLANALRHCDGGSIQTLLLVRDDYWPHASRFMEQLEIPLLQDVNCRAINLFDLAHAEQVLFEYGRAYGRFDSIEPTEAEQEFLDTVISELSVNGSVISVRLAFFAEAFRNKTWTPESLGQLGGAAGVGVAFLNDTFAAPKAPPLYRSHEKAAQLCLQALLPEAGSDLKGHMESRDQLLVASGYQPDEKRFEQLLEILDKDLRLITATDPVAASSGQVEVEDVTYGKYYQLSHDYLVPILRKWIDTEQQRRFTGRIKTRMNQIASIWGEVPDKRYLPTWTENFSFLLFTKWKSWTPLQREMMRASVQRHLFRTMLAAALFCLLMIASIWALRDFAANQKVASLKLSPLTEIQANVTALRDQKDVLIPKLHRELGSLLISKPDRPLERVAVEQQTLNVAIALADFDSSNWSHVAEGIFTVPLNNISLVTQLLLPQRDRYIQEYSAYLDSNPGDTGELAIRRALALAEWGHTRYLTKFALDSDPQSIRDFVPVLRQHQEISAGFINNDVDRIRTKVLSFPSPDLNQLFDDHGGVIDRMGAVIFALPLGKIGEIMEPVFDEGYLPISFRPFLLDQEVRVAISWVRNKEFIGEKFDSVVQVKSGLTGVELVAANEQMKNKNWRSHDISFFNNPLVGGTPVYSCIWIRNDQNIATKLDVDIDYSELDKKCLLNFGDGFQVERMFSRSGEQGEPMYSVIWTKDPENQKGGLLNLCYPEIQFPANTWDQEVGASMADCQIAEIDLSKRYLFDVREEMRKRAEKIKLELEDPTMTIRKESARHFGVYATQKCQLGESDTAIELFYRLVKDYPKWKDTNFCFAVCLSQFGDRVALERELERLNSIGLSTGEQMITVPLIRLRYAAHHGLTDEAEKIYQDFHLANKNLEQQYAENMLAVYGIRRGMIRSHLLLAGAHLKGSKKSIRLIDRAMERFDHPFSEDYRFLLSAQDYDIARGESRFQNFVRDQGYGFRLTKAWKIDSRRLTELEGGRTEAQLRLTAKNRFRDGFQPRCIACQFVPESDSIYGQSVWEREQVEGAEFGQKHEKRLANAALLLAELGQTDLLNEILSNTFGIDVRNLLSERLISNEFAGTNKSFNEN